MAEGCKGEYRLGGSRKHIVILATIERLCHPELAEGSTRPAYKNDFVTIERLCRTEFAEGSTKPAYKNDFMKNGHNYYVYIVECRDESYYTGVTNGLEKPLKKWSRKKKEALFIEDWEELKKLSKSRLRQAQPDNLSESTSAPLAGPPSNVRP